MNRRDSSSLERRLRQHYQTQRNLAPSSTEQKANLVALMTSEKKRIAAFGELSRESFEANACPKSREHEFDQAKRLTTLRFIAAQVRFVRPVTWAAQAGLIALLVIACIFNSAPNAVSPLASALGAATVLVGLPELLASKSNGTAELEYSCRFNCADVMLSRLIILGCSDVLTITCICLAVPALVGLDGLSVLVHVCVPYFLACSGSLMLARRCPGSAATTAAACWSVLVAAGSYAAFVIAPTLYATASNGLWALVAAVSFAWMLREAFLLVQAAKRGFDQYCPPSAIRLS